MSGSKNTIQILAAHKTATPKNVRMMQYNTNLDQRSNINKIIS